MLQLLKRMAARFAGVDQTPPPARKVFRNSNGRPRKLSQKDRQDIRSLYGTTAPNGRRYSFELLARLYGVSSATIVCIIKRRGSYAGESS